MLKVKIEENEKAQDTCLELPAFCHWDMTTEQQTALKIIYVYNAQALLNASVTHLAHLSLMAGDCQPFQLFCLNLSISNVRQIVRSIRTTPGICRQYAVHTNWLSNTTFSQLKNCYIHKTQEQVITLSLRIFIQCMLTSSKSPRFLKIFPTVPNRELTYAGDKLLSPETKIYTKCQ